MMRQRSLSERLLQKYEIRMPSTEILRFFIVPMLSPVYLKKSFCMANIPYKIIGGVNFYARKEIKDLLAYLKTIDNARDDMAVRRIFNVPKRGIGATTINRVQEYADGTECQLL